MHYTPIDSFSDLPFFRSLFSFSRELTLFITWLLSPEAPPDPPCHNNNNNGQTQQQQTHNTTTTDTNTTTTTTVRHNIKCQTYMYYIIVWNKLFTAFTFLHFYILLRIYISKQNSFHMIIKILYENGKECLCKNTDCLEINNKNILLQFISHFNFQTIFCAIAYMY